MKPRKAIIKKVAHTGIDTPVYVHQFGFDRHGDAVAIVETEKGNLAVFAIDDIKFENPPEL